MVHALACKVSEATVAFFASPLATLFFVAASLVSGGWCLIAPSELALTLFLSILALAITAALMFVGERRETRAADRDRALHQKIDELIHAIPAARDELAGIEAITGRDDTA